MSNCSIMGLGNVSVCNILLLDLSNNRLNSVPEDLNKCTKLKDLKLGYNPLTEIPHSLSKVETLERLDIDNTDVKTLHESIFKDSKIYVIT
eukprot:UN26240